MLLRSLIVPRVSVIYDFLSRINCGMRALITKLRFLEFSNRELRAVRQEEKVTARTLKRFGLKKAC